MADDDALYSLATDIATVLLDTDLRIRRATDAASHLLNLQPSDIGRPVALVASHLLDADIARDARAVLDSGTQLQREVTSQDGRHYIVRMLPSLIGGTARGVALTLVDVTLLKGSERELRTALERSATDLRRMTLLHKVSTGLNGPDDLQLLLGDIVRAAVDITGADMAAVQRTDETNTLAIEAQVGFEQSSLDSLPCVAIGTNDVPGAVLTSQTWVTIDDLTQSPLVADVPSRDALLRAGVRSMQSTLLFDRSGGCLGMLSTYYRIRHDFTAAERQWLDLLARHAGDIIDRRQTEARVARATETLEQRVANRSKWLLLLHDITRAINDAPEWDKGLRHVLRQICERESWQVGYVYLPDQHDPDTLVPMISHVGDDRVQSFHRASEEHRYARGQRLPGLVFAEGVASWVHRQEDLLKLIPRRADAARQVGLKSAVALPLRIGQKVIAVLELFSDRDHPPNHLLVNLMNDIGDQIGKVLERERATVQMADLILREQQALLHTLHDSLGQTLTGIGMLASGLSLRTGDTATIQSSAQIAQQAQVALEQVRRLSRGLFAAEIETAEGLLPALHSLASTTEAFHKIRVRVDGRHLTGTHDRRVAMELYRIAQEAVTNAVKHAQASSIRIELGLEPRVMQLRIIDNGVGMKAGTSPSSGVGLRIMAYRAASIGAKLSIEPGASAGTLVTCTLRATWLPALPQPGVRGEG